MLKVIVEKKKRKWNFHCACKFKIFGKNLDLLIL